eukprot:68073-Pyramimonas_sp.AAC.1
MPTAWDPTPWCPGGRRTWAHVGPKGLPSASTRPPPPWRSAKSDAPGGGSRQLPASGETPVEEQLQQGVDPSDLHPLHGT